jgi:hypothetical protein
MTDRHYNVGYKKPPRHTRFKKGQSGNPRGKAKGRKNLKTELLEELGERVIVSENGRHRALPKQTVIVKRMVADAVQGDAKARDQLLKLMGQIDAVEGSRQSSFPRLCRGRGNHGALQGSPYRRNQGAGRHNRTVRGLTCSAEMAWSCSRTII